MSSALSKVWQTKKELTEILYKLGTFEARSDVALSNAKGFNKRASNADVAG